MILIERPPNIRSNGPRFYSNISPTEGGGGDGRIVLEILIRNTGL